MANRILAFLFSTILVGLVASWLTSNEKNVVEAEVVADLNAELRSTDQRLTELLKQINEAEVVLFSLHHLWEIEGIGFVIYDEGKASDWTTSSIPFATELSRTGQLTNGLVQLKNGWYLCRSTQVGKQVLAAYALVKNSYNFQNQHVQNKWGPRFDGSGNLEFTTTNINSFPIEMEGDSETIYVRMDDTLFSGTSFPELAIWFLFILLLLATLWHSSNWLAQLTSAKFGSAIFISLLILLRAFMQWQHLPRPIYEAELFSPILHATSAILPSLGDFLLHLLFLLCVILRLRKFHPLKPTQTAIGSWIALLLPILLIWPVHYLFQILVFNSSFSFELTNPFSLTRYSFVGLMVTFLVLLNLVLTSRYLFALVDKEKRTIKNLALPWLVATSILFLSIGVGLHELIISVLGSLAIVFLLITERWSERMRDISLYTPTVLVFTLFASILLLSELDKEEKESRKAMVRHLAQRQNPITEYLFDGLQEKITSDRAIRNVLSRTPVDEQESLEAIHALLTYDHWNQYRSIVNVFDNEGKLLLSDQDRGGFNYNELQRFFETAKPTVSTNFHYVGDSSDDGGYLARISLSGRRSQPDLVLFVRLIPEQTDDLLGFTDLLIDEGISNTKQLEGYSYAQYQDGELKSKHGDYPYLLAIDESSFSPHSYQFYELDGYDHLGYRATEGTVILASKPKQGTIIYLTTFSYLFLFYFACTLILLMAEGTLLKNLFQRSSFRSRINLAMSSVLLVSMLLIGVLTVFYVIREYNLRNEEMISEKSRSVLIELEHKLRDRYSFEELDRPMLTALLNKFSKVFFTDINMYSLDGHMLATSRPRIFDEGLMAKVMDPEAYREMRFNQRSSFIHEETIGKLTYLTAYVPFRNEKREVVAFMSLPYFARQYGLQQQIFSLLAALTNIYVLLILISVVLALVISNRITEPLRFIRESLKNLKLDQANRAIEWNSKDEIGELVDEYNRTLNALVRSAELLARSERESAWREMAKQVAHEIKNPLTPMKLSIQMLQRSKNDGAEDLGQRIDKVTNTLIEQIDTLSNIATEFSSFAQMPKSNIERVDLKHLLENVGELYQNSDVEIVLDLDAEAECFVQADREQMLRVFNNLIKNGIQAVPDDRRPQITLVLKQDADQWTVSVRDNGSGIAEELKDRIFVPNFTTKSSGMGLGLAMVKNIIEALNGTITFTSEAAVGTTFYVSLPMATISS